MKILFTLDFPPEHGGIQRYLFNIVKHTFTEEDHVIVGNSNTQTAYVNYLPCTVEYVSIPFSRLNKKFSLLPITLSLIRKYLFSKTQPDIYAGNVFAAVPLYLVSLFKPVSFSVYCHGKELLLLKKISLKSWLLKRVLQRARQLFYTTEYVAQLLESCHIHNNLVHCPPRIDRSCIQPVPDNSNSSDPTLNLLSVGRLERHKGHACLIRAAAHIPAGIPWILTIAGSGPEQKTLETLITELNMQDKIKITGEITDTALAELYKHADIFIHPSLEIPEGVEGFGIVLLEAMAHRIPVIASRSGGIPEVLAEGACGRLVPPGKTDELMTAIVDLHLNSELRNQLVEQAILQIEKYYVW